MNQNIDLEKTTEYIFSLDWEKDFTDDELDNLNLLVENLIQKYGWPKVYETWCAYLHKKCNDDWSVVNFARHYWDYASERTIPDPVHFIAYLYYRVDTLSNDDAMQIFDSLATTILENAGLLNMVEQPLYTAERDPRIQDEIKRIKAAEN